MVICQQDCVLNRRDKLASWGWRGRRRRRPDIEWVSWVRWGLRAWGPNVWVWTFFPPAVSILKKCTGSWVPPSTISWAVLNITGAEVVVEMTFVVFHFAAMSFWKELAWSRHFVCVVEGLRLVSKFDVFFTCFSFSWTCNLIHINQCPVWKNGQGEGFVLEGIVTCVPLQTYLIWNVQGSTGDDTVGACKVFYSCLNFLKETMIW